MRRGTLVSLICFLQVGFVVPLGHANMLHFTSAPLQGTNDVNILPGVYSVDVNIRDQEKTDILGHNHLEQSVPYPHGDIYTEPVFSDYFRLASDEGRLVDLPETFRLRPVVTGWTVEDYSDILERSTDNKMPLFQGLPEPTTLFVIMSTAGLLLLRRRRRSAR